MGSNRENSIIAIAILENLTSFRGTNNIFIDYRTEEKERINKQKDAFDNFIAFS